MRKTILFIRSLIFIVLVIFVCFWFAINIGIITVYGESKEIKAIWEPNPQTENVLGYNLYWRYDSHIPAQIDYKDKPASFNNPYGIYIWQDSDDLEWHLWTTYAPEGSRHGYKNTKIISVGGRIEAAEYYSPEENETIKWDAGQILVENMSVNGTGGIDGIDFRTDAIDLEFYIIFSGNITAENIFIGKNKIKAKSLSFSLGQGRGYSKERLINQAGLIMPESYSGYSFMFDAGAEEKVYFVLTAVNEFGESGFSNEAIMDLGMIPPEQERPSHPIELRIERIIK
jgi:hypothetical protein